MTGILIFIAFLKTDVYPSRTFPKEEGIYYYCVSVKNSNKKHFLPLILIAMNYIELIGPPAAGKSTLLNLMIGSRVSQNKWTTYDEAISNIVRSLHWNQLPDWKNKILYLINKNNPTSYKKIGINNIIIQNLTASLPELVHKKYEYLVEAQLKAIQEIDIHISSMNKCSFLNWHLRSIQKLITLEYFKYNSTVVFAEGPFKTHYGLKYIDLNRIQYDTLPKAVVYCTLSIEENSNRIQTRENITGHVSKIHNQLNGASLPELIIYTHRIAENNFAFLKSIGIPTYQVDLTEHITESELSKINQFVTHYADQNSTAESWHTPLVCS